MEEVVERVETDDGNSEGHKKFWITSIIVLLIFVFFVFVFYTLLKKPLYEDAAVDTSSTEQVK